LEEIKSKWTGHLGAYPHKGTYVRPNWNFDKNYTPEMYSKDMQGWVDQGVKIIGSCCGMGPEYISDLKKSLVNVTLFQNHMYKNQCLLHILKIHREIDQ